MGSYDFLENAKLGENKILLGPLLEITLYNKVLVMSLEHASTRCPADRSAAQWSVLLPWKSCNWLNYLIGKHWSGKWHLALGLSLRRVKWKVLINILFFFKVNNNANFPKKYSDHHTVKLCGRLKHVTKFHLFPLCSLFCLLEKKTTKVLVFYITALYSEQIFTSWNTIFWVRELVLKRLCRGYEKQKKRCDLIRLGKYTLNSYKWVIYVFPCIAFRRKNK